MIIENVDTDPVQLENTCHLQIRELEDLQMQIYGLFKMSYDYYEWEELLFVSRNKNKLVSRAETMVKAGSQFDPQIILDMESEDCLDKYKSMRQEHHYQIRPLEVL